MMTWFPYSILATILLGLSMVCYKFPSTKNVDRYGVMFWSLLFSEILSLLFFAKYFTQAEPRILFWSALWGVSFASLSLLQMYALRHVDTGTLFPVTSSLSLVITIMLGFVFFAHTISTLQVGGIALTVLAVALFLFKKGKLEYSFQVLAVGVSIVGLSAGNKIIQKIVADGFDIRSFQIYQYFFATLFALFVYSVSQKSMSVKKLAERRQIAIGALIGVLGFFGGYALLIALSMGPFALVFSIHSMYIFVVAFAGALLFREKLTQRKIFALVLACIAIVLIRVG